MCRIDHFYVCGSPCIKDIEEHRQNLSWYLGAFRNSRDKLSVPVVGATSLLPPMSNHQAANGNGSGVYFVEPKGLEP